MNKKVISLIVICIVCSAQSACLPGNEKNSMPKNINIGSITEGQNNERVSYDQAIQTDIYEGELEQLKKSMAEKYQNIAPKQWGENVDGVVRKVSTTSKVVALTFDACGGSTLGSGYDKELIDFLIKENIKATLFINARWIDANSDLFKQLSSNSLFEIENHGYLHKPLSTNGKAAYGIIGTRNIGEVIEEIMRNQAKISGITGRKLRYFRSGTAYYDEVAVKIAGELGLKVINYNVLGDAGATFSSAQVNSACLSATPGAIILMHMNHPESGTAEGVKLAIPELSRKGYSFVKLEEYDAQLITNIIEVGAVIHKVVAGDTLWKLSMKYAVGIMEIMRYNNLGSDRLYIGQSIKIPVGILNAPSQTKEIVHIVTAGDTLWKIAQKYNTTLNNLTRTNNLDASKPIYIGQRIRIVM